MIQRVMWDALVFSMILIVVGYVARLTVRSPDRDLCPNCGYNLSGHARPAICPECGIPEAKRTQPITKTNKAHGHVRGPCD